MPFEPNVTIPATNPVINLIINAMANDFAKPKPSVVTPIDETVKRRTFLRPILSDNHPQK